MKVFGLTGGTGSGKTVVANILREKNGYIIDADQIGHDIILKGKPAYDEIIKHFGTEILDENKEIIRRKLGEIVFSDKLKLNLLNECTHKHIVNEILRQIDYAKKGNFLCVVIDAALLIDVGLTDICDEIIVVVANDDVRLERIMKRDGITADVAKNRIKSQKPSNDYIKAGTIIIDNSSDIENVKIQLNNVKF